MSDFDICDACRELEILHEALKDAQAKLKAAKTEREAMLEALRGICFTCAYYIPGGTGAECRGCKSAGHAPYEFNFPLFDAIARERAAKGAK